MGQNKHILFTVKCLMSHLNIWPLQSTLVRQVLSGIRSSPLTDAGLEFWSSHLDKPVNADKYVL